MPISKTIDPAQFGVSFSAKQCRGFDIDPTKTLNWLIHDAGFRRFRLMSYWDEHQKQPGKYDFKELDRQIKAIERAGGVISLCLGARQPRWPENHWPDWVWKLGSTERSEALLNYIEVVVKRYKDKVCVISYQLENEALLQNFGERAEIDRERLRQEYALVKQLDNSKPIIMTTSNSWGLPLRQPIPDQIGFSMYHTQYRDGRYYHARFLPRVQPLRKLVVKALRRKPVFIHELQLEPWGPAAIWKMTFVEQAKSMNPQKIAKSLATARRVKAAPIDLWGGEWWYWRLANHTDKTIWQAVSEALHTT